MSAIATVSGVFGKALRAPLLVKAGAGCGALAGVTLGFMVSAPVGLVLGIAFGVGIGAVAGIVMDRDEKRTNHRTRELDDIIGVTSGNLGRPSVPPEEALSFDDAAREAELRSWVEEWLTPPAPRVV